MRRGRQRQPGSRGLRPQHQQVEAAILRQMTLEAIHDPLTCREMNALRWSALEAHFEAGG